MSNRRHTRDARNQRARDRRINGHAPGPKLVVPTIVGHPAEEWTDLPPAAYPPVTVERVILPRLEAGADLVRRNVYQCVACNGLTVTYDRHPGVTPAYVDHRRFDPDTRCDGVTASLSYPRDLPPETEASHEWFRPSEDVLVTLGDAAIDHVLKGGLLLRPIAAVATRQLDEELGK